VTRFLPKGEFGRNVLTVMSGTVVAQAIPVLVSPILTRMFTPADIGTLALYLSIVAVAVVVATGRYELAILLPRYDREAFDLLLIAVGLALLLCLLGLIGIVVARSDWMRLGRDLTLGLWIYLVPFSVLLTAVMQSLSYWANRKKHYRHLVSSRVAQSGAMCATQVIAGTLRAGTGGLVTGHAIGQLAGCALLILSIWKHGVQFQRRHTLARFLAVARRHRNLPKYLVPGHLANVASSQMPILLLTVFYGPAVAGFYSLAERVLVLPSSIVGSAVGDVYRQQAALSYQTIGNCRALYLTTARKLALAALAPCALAVLLGPWLFSIVFGPFWREAGVITSMLAAMVFFQIISSPLSQTVLLGGMYRLDMVWQVARLFLSVGTIYVGYAVSGSPQVSIALYAAAFAMLHAVHSLMQYRAACGMRTLRGRPMS
jgi:O-antigen/teichoic acid export membrane protein